ncbi:hypothetical protein [Mucilaginibacter sp.]|uniref:hypothetical protein n=1 Tax=Mucilaginibacter sp. TaxID=1882438 RepID=UPI0032668293
MTIKHTLMLLAFAGFGLASCQTKTAEPAETADKLTAVDPTDLLSLDTAKRYVANYRAGTVDSIQADGKHVPLPNSRAIWFSKAKLEAMLESMRGEKGDGVRFYFAAYDPKLGVPTGNSPDPKYAGYNTLIMVSTVNKDTLGQKGLHWDSYTKPGVKGGIIMVGAGPENRGEMCPPPSNCPAIGATLIP